MKITQHTFDKGRQEVKLADAVERTIMRADAGSGGGKLEDAEARIAKLAGHLGPHVEDFVDSYTYKVEP